ncbi:hypothetical protein [Psychrobacter sp. KCTC 72983]|uniref:hypothetical protein n=1 Tax=Psychrobacter sp. KCTC 72983 TaxID=2733866 RepID=UPI0016440F72|nr:hypothetical protein [Psychrobacter sp. KCTC 72983]
MINNKTASSTSMNTAAIAADLARVAAYAHTLGQLCELSPHAEPLSLEQLEVIFKDIAQVCDASVNTIQSLNS